MKTQILKANNEQDILTAISMIQSGQIVAIPTETVYGLAADARNIDAVKKIFSIKNRPANHPLIVHIASLDNLSEWAKDIPSIAFQIGQHFWPGPITLLLKKHDSVNNIITGGLDTIAIRIPQNNTVLKILKTLNTAVAAPSANPHKRISPTTAEHVMSGLSGKIAAVLDAGPCQIGIESTIIDLTKDKISILRHGPITKEMIEAIINAPVATPSTHTESVAGNMKCHYQPYTKTSLMTLNEIKKYTYENQEKKIGIIHYSNLDLKLINIKAIKLSSIKTEYSKEIYNSLHELDTLNLQEILIETPPNQPLWNDILDRLLKASAKNN